MQQRSTPAEPAHAEESSTLLLFASENTAREVPIHYTHGHVSTHTPKPTIRFISSGFTLLSPSFSFFPLAVFFPTFFEGDFPGDFAAAGFVGVLAACFPCVLAAGFAGDLVATFATGAFAVGVEEDEDDDEDATTLLLFLCGGEATGVDEDEDELVLRPRFEDCFSPPPPSCSPASFTFSFDIVHRA